MVCQAAPIVVLSVPRLLLLLNYYLDAMPAMPVCKWVGERSRCVVEGITGSIVWAIQRLTFPINGMSQQTKSALLYRCISQE